MRVAQPPALLPGSHQRPSRATAWCPTSARPRTASRVSASPGLPRLRRAGRAPASHTSLAPSRTRPRLHPASRFVARCCSASRVALHASS
uniref:Uncharacterized protein n=1 Tax=Arundo donax TaxID=35708 RepID=A0A0A9ANJ7_ARUDO